MARLQIKGVHLNRNTVFRTNDMGCGAGNIGHLSSRGMSHDTLPLWRWVGSGVIAGVGIGFSGGSLAQLTSAIAANDSTITNNNRERLFISSFGSNKPHTLR